VSEDGHDVAFGEALVVWRRDSGTLRIFLPAGDVFFSHHG